MRKILAGIALSLGLMFSLSACGGEEEAVSGSAKAQENEAAGETGQAAAAADSEWAVYWYLCGSDLETGGGCATADLAEMMEAELPENVKVVIETGGASVWQNEAVDASKLQRWVYDGAELTLVDEQPSSNMGEADTLADFLSYASTNYPAKKTAVIFWNHGGGSVTGAAFDELYQFDSLTLDELRQAFTFVWPADGENPPLELVGFDTCLMATVDVAGTFSEIAHYLVASEEVEPGNGWYYSHWLGALGGDPSMDGEALGKVICDTYYQGCEAVGTQQQVTLSLVDLTKTGPLLEAYDTFGGEVLAAACQDPAMFSEFARAAFASENYGGNTKEQGYSNMVDLGDLAR